MKRNFNVIKIDGFKGLFFSVFIIGCLIAGFLSFPGWVCMHVWNFIAEYFSNMPTMSMTHGVILWCIIALSTYALNKGNFAVSFGSVQPVNRNEERIKEILKRFNEENEAMLKAVKEDIKKSEIKKEEEIINSDNNDETVLK